MHSELSFLSSRLGLHRVNGITSEMCQHNLFCCSCSADFMQHLKYFDVCIALTVL